MWLVRYFFQPLLIIGLHIYQVLIKRNVFRHFLELLSIFQNWLNFKWCWVFIWVLITHDVYDTNIGGGEIAQSLASLSVKPAIRVRALLNLLVSERWNSIKSAIYLFPPVLTTGSTKAVHVLSCLCGNACKRSLAICRKSRASCPVSRLLSVPT